MKDYNYSPTKSKSEDVSLQDKSLRLLPTFARCLIAICGIGLVVLVLMQIPSLLLSPVRSINIRGNEILSEEKIIENLSIDKEHTWLYLDPFQLSLNLKQITSQSTPANIFEEIQTKHVKHLIITFTENPNPRDIDQLKRSGIWIFRERYYQVFYIFGLYLFKNVCGSRL